MSLIYQKEINGCHQCPNSNESTKNGNNRVCTKDINWRLVGKYIKEKRYPKWCPILENMLKQKENLLKALEQNWRI